MSVLGIGLDLCPIERMKQAVDRHGDRFLRRIFTAQEQAYAREAVGGMAQSLAARFAAKEAASKAIGAPKGIGWHDVEVVPARRGIEGRARSDTRILPLVDAPAQTPRIVCLRIEPVAPQEFN